MYAREVGLICVGLHLGLGINSSLSERSFGSSSESPSELLLFKGDNLLNSLQRFEFFWWEENVTLVVVQAHVPPMNMNNVHKTANASLQEIVISVAL